MFEAIDISMVTAMYLYIACFGMGLLFMTVLYVFIEEQRRSYLYFFLYFLFALVGALLIALRATVGNFTGIIIANGMIIVGFMMVPYGIQKVLGLKQSWIPYLVLFTVYVLLFIYGTYINFNVGFRVFAFNTIIILILGYALFSLQKIRKSKVYLNEIMTMALITMLVMITVRIVNFIINVESANTFLQYQVDSFFVVLSGISNIFVIPGLLSIIQSQQSEKLHELSEVDALTGLKNRRSLIEYAGRIWRQSKRDKVWISVFMLDIDYFKQFNDNHGHAYGDVILRAIAEALNQVVKRPLDVVSRYGGEEFVVILYECDYDNAMNIADDIHTNVRALDVYLDDEQTKPLSVSIGYVSLIASDKYDFDTVIKEADSYMYKSKEKKTNKTTGQTIE